MVDRQDIDALLVGALYGELTPADEARLAAHLESHPADRAALEDLKTARHAVKQSRIFEIQDEPPQAVSALLLQEAHRRAPRPARAAEEKEGWFARLTRSFFAHPAMAAAAMLVVVVGVAGTLYLRKGGSDELVYTQTAPTATQPTQGAAPSPAADNAAELDTGAAGAGSGYAVQLDEMNREEAKQQLQKRESERQKQAESKSAIAADKSDGDSFGYRGDGKVARPTAKPPAVTPRMPEPQPKDIAEAPKPAHKGAAPSSFGLAEGQLSRSATGGGVAGPSGRDQAAMAPAGEAAPAPAAPPPPPPKASVATAAPAPGRNDAKSDPIFAWAQKQLQQAIQLTRDNKCKDAAKVALDIRNRAPAFYNENVADNRELKHCATYIRNNVDESSDRAKKMSPAKSSDMESMH